jgi:phosphatidate cytidylyltransferase
MTRVASGALMVALLLAAIWWLPWWVTACLGVLTAARAGVELSSLAAAVGVPVSRAVPAAAAGTVVLAVAFSDPRAPIFVVSLLPTALAAVALAGGLSALRGAPAGQATFVRAGIHALAPVYLGVPIGVLVGIQLTEGPAMLTWLLLVIAVSDSAQYYSGRAFGRRPLAPVISPAKTIEGAIGGLLAAALAGAAGAAYLLPGARIPTAAGVAVLLALAGMAGDLFESLLKRSAGVKDSAALIPGHGGVLDRIDSYLFAAPMFYLLLAAMSFEL